MEGKVDHGALGPDTTGLGVSLVVEMVFEPAISVYVTRFAHIKI